MSVATELDQRRRVLFVAPGDSGLRAAASAVLPYLRERDWEVGELWLTADRSPALWVGLRAWWRTRSARREAAVVHVELGKLDLPCFWFALLSAVTGTRTTLTAHDAPMLALHPVAGLLPQRSRLAQIVTYRLLAPLLDRPLEGALLRRARAVAVLSEVAVESWQGSPSPRRVLVVAHGADPRGPQGPPSEGQCVLLAGYLGPSKGVDTLLDAWREMGHESSLPLWILGDTTGETHRDWLEGLRRESAGFPNPPVWLGSASDEQWRECFRRAAVVVLPYRYSSPASGPLVRAMVEGRAIVMSEVPATRGLIVDGENGLTVPRDDPRALAEALRRVLNDVELTVRLGRAAERTAAERFSWAANARGIEHTLIAGLG